jgi:predicted nicotinamide N-methyase
MLLEFEFEAIGRVRIGEMSAASLHRLSTREYWRRVWPAGLGLAAYIIRRFGAKGLGGYRVLDLGCGVGLIGIVCRQLGARVTFLDRERRALAAVRRNCRLNGLGKAQTISGDWNHGGQRLRRAAYDMVVGGDVVYDELEWRAICSALTRALRADGIALLADPGWVEQSKMQAAFRQSGFAVSKEIVGVRWPPGQVKGQRRKGIDIYRLRRRKVK